MPTTSNFGWTTPADTDLVKDGAAAIRTLGNGIDTSFLDLKGGTTGQVLSKASNTDLDFSWVAVDPLTILDAKGDLISATAADTPARLAVGTDGQYLSADSSTSTGLKWVSAAGSGLTCIKAETAFSAVSSFTVDSIFSSTYTNYMIAMRYTTSTTNNVNLQFRASGSTAATNYNSQFFAGDNTTADVARLSSQTSLQLARSTNGSFTAFVTAQISGPFLAEATLVATQLVANGGAYTSPISAQHIHNHSTATSYDGFIASVSTGTFSGSYTIYGYAKAV